MNIKNKEIYDYNYRKHIQEGGTSPMECALTELVKKCIELKDFKIYRGGGYSTDGDSIDEFDVVCYIPFSNDPFFMVCWDNSEGDECILKRCSPQVKIETIIC